MCSCKACSKDMMLSKFTPLLVLEKLCFKEIPATFSPVNVGASNKRSCQDAGSLWIPYSITPSTGHVFFQGRIEFDADPMDEKVDPWNMLGFLWLKSHPLFTDSILQTHMSIFQSSWILEIAESSFLLGCRFRSEANGTDCQDQRDRNVTWWIGLLSEVRRFYEKCPLFLFPVPHLFLEEREGKQPGSVGDWLKKVCVFFSFE